GPVFNRRALLAGRARARRSVADLGKRVERRAALAGGREAVVDGLDLGDQAGGAVVSQPLDGADAHARVGRRVDGADIGEDRGDQRHEGGDEGDATQPAQAGHRRSAAAAASAWMAQVRCGSGLHGQTVRGRPPASWWEGRRRPVTKRTLTRNRVKYGRNLRARVESFLTPPGSAFLPVPSRLTEVYH